VTQGFEDRRDAGLALGARLAQLQLQSPIVFGLARGGIPVAYEVARALAAPLEVLVVRKIGAPANPELAVGALSEDGVPVFNEEIITDLGMGADELDQATALARSELEARLRRYRGARPRRPVTGSTAIVVDDGLATGASARAALRCIRANRPSGLILATPVGAPRSAASLEDEADQVICLIEPREMGAVGHWYRNFAPTPDDEVATLLTAAERARSQ
jgi:putative phosphoribosyl transferase